MAQTDAPPRSRDESFRRPAPARSEAVRVFPEVAGVAHRFVDTPRLRFHVAEAGAGEPVLLLHGWPQHWWAWRKVIPLLADDYRVIARIFVGSVGAMLRREAIRLRSLWMTWSDCSMPWVSTMCWSSVTTLAGDWVFILPFASRAGWVGWWR